MSVRNFKIALLGSVFLPMILIFGEIGWLHNFLNQYWMYFLPLSVLFLFSVAIYKIDADNFFYSLTIASSFLLLLFSMKIIKMNILVFISFGICLIYLFGKAVQMLFEKNVHTSTNLENFSSDLPITSKEKDLFEFSRGAKRLSDLIMFGNLAIKGSYVIGVSGPWGSGKSSFINLALEDIYGKNDSDTQVIKLFPWFHCKHLSMEEQFLSSLNKQGILNDGELKKYFLKYAKTLDIAFANFGEKIFEILISDEKDEDIDETQKHINNYLISNNKKIAVVIDDLDRLSADEILNVFQLVKATACFKNVIYVLGYDYEQLKRIMEGHTNSWASDYLEKIVQKKVAVPFIPKTKLIAYLFNRIDEVIEDTEGNFDFERWTNMSLAGFRDLFRTPRDVERYINSLKFTYGNLKDKVDIVDLLVMTAILVRYPETQEQIYQNFSLLTVASNWVDTNTEKTEVRQEKFLDEIDKSLHKLFKELFPSLQPLSLDVALLKKKKRIMHYDYFEIFFRQFNPEKIFFPEEMQFYLSNATELSCEKIIENLSEINLTENVSIIEFTESFPEYIDEIESLTLEKWFIFWLVNFMKIPSRFPTGLFATSSQRIVIGILDKICEKEKWSASKIIELFKVAKSKAPYQDILLYSIMLLVERFLTDPLNRSEKLLEIEELKREVLEMFSDVFEKKSWSGFGVAFYLFEKRDRWTGNNQVSVVIEENLFNLSFMIDLITECYTHSYGKTYCRKLRTPFLGGKYPLERVQLRIKSILEGVEKNELAAFEIERLEFFLKSAEVKFDGTEEFYYNPIVD